MRSSDAIVQQSTAPVLAITGSSGVVGWLTVWASISCITLWLSGCGGFQSPPRDDCPEKTSCGAVQLLVDETPFLSVSGLYRTLGTMRKIPSEPLIKEERFYGSALLIGDIFRLYVLGGRVYESADGQNFNRRPDLVELKLEPAEPSVTVTRYILQGDSNPIYLAVYPDFTVRANIAYSNDGVRFFPLNSGQPVTGRAADTFNQLMFDPLQQKFRLSTRTDFGDPGGPGEVRGTRTTINSDIFNQPMNWDTISEWVLSPRYSSTEKQIYGKTEFIERGVYFALAMVYKQIGDLSEGGIDHFTRHESDVIDLYLLSSRNGITWDTYWIDHDKPLIPRGGHGDFDKDMIVPAAQPITTQSEHLLYYSGANERHDIVNRSWGISRATLPRDRLVCQASENGSATFKPLRVAQNYLEVNLDTSNGKADFWLNTNDGGQYGPVSVSGTDGLLQIPYNNFKREDGTELHPVFGDFLTLNIRLIDAKLCAVAL